MKRWNKSYIVFWPSFLVELFLWYQEPIKELKNIFKNNNINYNNSFILITEDLESNLYNYIPYHIAKDIWIQTIKKWISKMYEEIKKSFNIIYDKWIKEELETNKNILWLSKGLERTVSNSIYKNNTKSYSWEFILKNIQKYKDNEIDRITEYFIYIMHGDLIRNLPLILNWIYDIYQLLVILLRWCLKNYINEIIFNTILSDTHKIILATNTIKKTERIPFLENYTDIEILDFKKNLLCFILYKNWDSIYLFDHLSEEEALFNEFLEYSFKLIVNTEN